MSEAIPRSLILCSLRADKAVDLFDNWFDPIETEVRARCASGFIEELLRGELDAALARPRYERSKMACNEAESRALRGTGTASRTRSLTGTFGPIEIAVPARPADHVRGRDDGMEEPGAEGLSAAHACC